MVSTMGDDSPFWEQKNKKIKQKKTTFSTCIFNLSPYGLTQISIGSLIGYKI